MGKRAVLSVSEEEVCAYRNQYPVASQQNTANHFPYYGTTPSVDALLIYSAKIVSEKKYSKY
jgi:hypothetical protein